MREYMITTLLSAVLCYVITPGVKVLAERFGAVAQIRSRDVHALPTARWGGLAMWISTALTLFDDAVEGKHQRWREIRGRSVDVSSFQSLDQLQGLPFLTAACLLDSVNEVRSRRASVSASK